MIEAERTKIDKLKQTESNLETEQLRSQNLNSTQCFLESSGDI
jgi:hypothetical protein